MNRRIRMRIVAVATTIAWAALVIDITPWLFDLADDASRLVLTVAGVGSLIIAIAGLSRPAAEVYEVGYNMGHSEGRQQGHTEAAMKRAARIKARNVVQFRRQA